MATQIMNVSDVRRRFSELLTELVDPIYITVYGKPSAVLVSYDAYEGLLARMEDLEDSLDALSRRDEPTLDFETAVKEMDAVSAQP